MSADHSASDAGLRLLAPLMDVPSALKRLGNDFDLFNQIIQIYLEDAPELFESANRAVVNQDAPSLRRAAHSLKGLAATISAQHAVSAAFRLEQIGASGELNQAADSLRDLELRLTDLNAVLNAYCREVGVSGRHGHTLHSSS